MPTKMNVSFAAQYVKSKNCQLEFRFATITLKIPVVLAVVGTGFEWEKSEVNKYKDKNGSTISFERQDGI